MPYTCAVAVWSIRAEPVRLDARNKAVPKIGSRAVIGGSEPDREKIEPSSAVYIPP